MKGNKKKYQVDFRAGLCPGRLLKSITTVVCMLVALLIYVPRAGAAWNGISYAFKVGTENKVAGPNNSYTSTKPENENWTMLHSLSNHTANLTGKSIRVFSASAVTFHDYNVSSGNARANSFIILKIDLSTPINAFTWDIGSHYVKIKKGAKFRACYSTDGKKWSDAYLYPSPFAGNHDPVSVTVSLSSPAKELYIGWFANVPGGKTGYWNLSNTGRLTFTPDKLNKTSQLTVKKPSNTPDATRQHTAKSSPRSRGFIPKTFFGTTTHVNRKFDIQLLEDLSIRAVRLDFHYKALEPNRGKYDFSSGNWIIKSADLGIKNGLDQIALISQAPKWAANENGTFPNDKSIKAFEDFVYAIASKYKGKIKIWEAMNEPDMAIWKERYVILLKAFYRGVKRADPNNKVLMASFAGNEASQLAAAYRHGAKGYFDILGSHSYTRPKLPEEGGYLDKIEDIRQVMKKYGDDKPLWVTEMGWVGVEPSTLDYLRSSYVNHRNYSCTEENQARGLVRLYLLSATVPWIERVYFFNLRQSKRYTEESPDANSYMGLVAPWLQGSHRPKRAYFAVKTAIKMLGDSTYQGRIDTNPRIWALAFAHQSKTVIALWSLDDDVTMTLKDSSLVKAITSMVGTSILVTANGQLSLSGSPIYLECELDKSDRLKKQISQATVLGITNFQLSLDDMKICGKNNQPVVEIRVTNTSNHTLTLPKIYLSSSISRQPKQTEINDPKPFSTGETRVYPVTMTKSAKKYGENVFDLSARFVDGKRTSFAKQTFRYLILNKKPDAFKADGYLGEWKGLPVTIGAVPAQREFSNWRGLKDCTAQWYCAWDQKGLYFAAEIRDDIHYQTKVFANASDMWRGDSIQLGIDLGGDAKASSNISMYDNINDVEIGFALGKEGPIANIYYNSSNKTGVVSLKDYAIVRDKTAGLTRYEVFIPWALFGFDKDPSGRWMRMNILVNDNDGKGRRGWVEWAPGIGYTKDPSKFPKVFMGNTKK